MKKYIIIFTLLLTANLGFSQNKVIPNLEKKTDQKKMTQWVDSVFNSMTMDQRIGQLITAITTGEDTEANRKKLLGYVKNQHVGGIIFLKGTPMNQANLTNLLQKNANTPLLISIDGEWGLSMRLENTTRFPKNMMLGALRNDSLMYLYGKEMARQCKLMGIHINYAPDLDVNSNPDNPVIGIRSYGEDPKRVVQLGKAYSKGLEDGGILSVSKHFPGHGDTSTDSHHTLPVINHDRNRLNEIEISTFKEYINAGYGGVMVGHLNIPALDNSGAPSSLSKPIITDLLQKELGFTGLVFTDGLAMKGVANEPNMSVRILQAGNDVILGPISPEKEFKAIKAAIANKTLSEDLINEKCKKILKWKYILNVPNSTQVNTKNLLDTLNSSYAEWLTRKLNEKSITLLKNEGNILPLENLDKRKIAVVSIGSARGNEFQKTMGLYGNVATFSATSADALAGLKTTLAKYNTIVVAIHSTKGFSDAAIQNICKGKQSVLVFLTTPYSMKNYSASIGEAKGLVVGYENTRFAQEYAAQAIYGGNPVDGILPVSVKGLFNKGTGLKINKERLSYNLPEDVGIPSDKLKKIEKIVNEGLEAKAYPGCQVLIAKNGVVIYSESFGTFSFDSKKKVTGEALYDVASMTKAVATVPALMKLYDEKKIALRNKLSDFVPVLKNTDKSTITVREALLHETGLPSFLPYYMSAIDTDSYSGKLFNAKQTALYNAEFDNTTWARTDYKFKPNLISTTKKKGYDLQIADNLYANKSYKDTLLQTIADSKLRASKKYLYSCLNFMLLKEAIEGISKTDLNTFLQQNYYQKLGADYTTYNPLTKFEKSEIVPTEKDDFLRKQLLQGYAHDEGAAFLGGISGNAGIFSNANDLAKLCQMYLNNGEYGGDRYLSKETCRTFFVTTSGTSRRGLGFDKPDAKNTKSNPCSPSTPLSTFGHTGFTGTAFWVDPNNQLIYIFLSNRVNPKRSNKKLMSMNIRSRIQEEIYNAIKK